MNSENLSTSSKLGSENDGSLSFGFAPELTLTKPIVSLEVTTASTPSFSNASEVSGLRSSPLEPASMGQLQIEIPGDLKQCYGCHRVLPIEVFASLINHGVEYRNRRCNRCRSERAKGSPLVLSKRARVEEAKRKPCVDCGHIFPSVAMDLDHVKGKKTYNIGTAYRWLSMMKLEEEIAKCEPVCACCHRVRSSTRPGQRPGRPPKFLAKSEREVPTRLPRFVVSPF